MPGDPLMAAAVLCGGAGRRMGQGKAALSLQGASLLDRALWRLRPYAKTLIIASGRTRLLRPGCLTVLDQLPDRGPLGGIVAALEAAPEPLCAVVAVDMPDLDPLLLRALAQECDAAVPLSARGQEPLHAVYARSALPALQRALTSPEVSVVHALEGMRVRNVHAAALGAAPAFAANLNRPDDVREWVAAHR